MACGLLAPNYLTIPSLFKEPFIFGEKKGGKNEAIRPYAVSFLLNFSHEIKTYPYHRNFLTSQVPKSCGPWTHNFGSTGHLPHQEKGLNFFFQRNIRFWKLDNFNAFSVQLKFPPKLPCNSNKWGSREKMHRTESSHF